MKKIKNSIKRVMLKSQEQSSPATKLLDWKQIQGITQIKAANAKSNNQSVKPNVRHSIGVLSLE